MPHTIGHSNCTLPLALLAALPTSRTAKRRSGRGPKERISFVLPSRSCWAFPRPTFVWCLSKRPAATATTERMTLRGDAALLSQAVGKPVRVQWMRHDEHGWEPLGPAMVMEVRGAVDSQGNVMAWDYQVWTPTHSSRPNASGGSLLAGSLAGISAGK